MPSTIATQRELERRLDAAIDETRRAAERHPDVEAMAEILAQLGALRAARAPVEVRDALDFGQIASREVHAIEPELARELYEIASWVAYA